MMNALLDFLLMLTLAVAPYPDNVAPSQDEVLHNSEFYCVALTVFSEARGEPTRGQALVAQVIINRQNKHGWACDVVAEPEQFAGWQDWPYPHQPWKTDPMQWTVAQAVSRLVMFGYFKPDPCSRARSFHIRDGTHGLCQVGNHVFF